MSLREGACATFIGASKDGAVGDRCLVLSDEGTYANVRWVTGASTGSYARVMAGDLAADRKTKVSAFDGDDEFGFEPEPPKAVRVASGVVHASGGDEALMRALEHDGVLDGPRQIAIESVRSLKATLLQDRAWLEVLSELGSNGQDFLRHAVSTLIISALNDEGEAREEEV